jgi:ABC-2 type transport system permease protein
MTATLAPYLALSRRAIVNVFRQPTSVVPTMLFPLLFLALSSAAFDRTTGLPGFPPVESFLQVLIATTIIQGALFGSTAAGADMATDIEGGFFERLVAAPVPRNAILVGRLAGSATIGFLQAWLYFGVGTLFGLDVAGGIPAMFLVSIVAALIAAGIGSVSVAMAIRTGSTEAVQGSFPLMFALMFVSSAFFPRDLMDGWYKMIAGINPLSHLIEGVRHQVIFGLDAGEYITALLIAFGFVIFGVTLSGRALVRRLAAA